MHFYGRFRIEADVLILLVVPVSLVPGGSPTSLLLWKRERDANQPVYQNLYFYNKIL